MMKKICKNCQYFRESHWCSNSKSPKFRYKGGSPLAVFANVVMEDDTCEAFSQRGKKAPIFKRMLIKIMSQK